MVRKRKNEREDQRILLNWFRESLRWVRMFREEFVAEEGVPVVFES